MTERRTTSILERAPVILAVTAASYGLPERGHAQRSGRNETSRQAPPRPFVGRLPERTPGKMALRY